MSRKRKSFSQESSGGKKSSGTDFKSKKSKKQLDPAKAQHNKNNKNAVKEQPPAVLVGGGGDAPWSKSKKKRMRLLKSKLLKKQEQQQGGVSDSAAAMDTKNSSSSSSRRNESATKRQAEPASSKSTSATASSSLPLPLSGGSRLSALQESFTARLSGSRFRLLNEELYTTTSSTAFERFSAHPELYDEYHDGFRSQVEHWPVNPVDVIVGRLKKDVDIFDETKSNSSNNKKKIVVADFGCGDADLAKQLLQVKIPLKSGKRQKGGDDGNGSTTWCPFQVHSFDLVSRSELVTACDMSNVPLQKGTVDVAVFCLSLMGTNLADFVREAHRVLKSNGRLKIAEVKSRFSSSSSGSNSKNNNKKSRNDSSSKNSGRQDEEKEFVRVLKQLGFECTRTDRSNKMFLLFELRKNGKAPDQNVEYTAKPCIYKRR